MIMLPVLGVGLILLCSETLAQEEEQEIEKPRINYVVNLTDKNFDQTVFGDEFPYLVAFTAPSKYCPPCAELENDWIAAAEIVKDVFKIAQMDALEHKVKAKLYKVKGYPTIKYWAGGDKSQHYFPELEAFDYNGGRSAREIVMWCVDRLKNGDEEMRYQREMQQMVENNVVNLKCGKVSICVVLTLPREDVCNTKCRESHLDILDTLERLNQDQKKWGFFWLMLGDYMTLEQAIEVEHYTVPAMAAIFVKKTKYALIDGPFNQEQAFAFIDDVDKDKVETNHLRMEIFPMKDKNDIFSMLQDRDRDEL